MVASTIPAALPDLHQKFSVASKSQYLIVLRTCSGNPHRIFPIDINTVLQFRPFIAITRTSPPGNGCHPRRIPKPAVRRDRTHGSHSVAVSIRDE